MTSETMTLRHVKVRVQDGSRQRDILNIPELEVPKGSLVGLRGASGAGKTTLLRLISGLRPPAEGEVLWGQMNIFRLSEQARDAWRGSRVGFVFQDFRLFPTLSALENVLVPATFRKYRAPADVQAHGLELLHNLGINHGNQRAETLSRGEQQRVAVARALLFRPDVVLADEPTASLDADNSRVVLETLLEYASTHGATLCVVSHDLPVLDRLPLRLKLERGQLLFEQGCN